MSCYLDSLISEHAVVHQEKPELLFEEDEEVMSDYCCDEDEAMSDCYYIDKSGHFEGINEDGKAADVTRARANENLDEDGKAADVTVEEDINLDDYDENLDDDFIDERDDVKDCTGIDSDDAIFRMYEVRKGTFFHVATIFHFFIQVVHDDIQGDEEILSQFECDDKNDETDVTRARANENLDEAADVTVEEDINLDDYDENLDDDFIDERDDVKDCIKHKNK